MSLRVHNTRTNGTETFTPRQPGHVRMYVCGPSVYDESHLGHARSYVVYDAMKRILRAKGLRVTHVQNFTDVEEHIAERARRAGMEPLAYASMIIAHFFRDMDELRILHADHYPRVSEHVPDILRMVEGLTRKGIAYRFDCGPRPHVAGGACDVYFDVTRVPDYGSLIGANVEELTVERPEQMGDRRNPLDFALWKSRDDWGVTWDSPWGTGRPGWHVECAAMSTKYLGFDFDIHGGGLDLVFPHHENERAIGEAYSGVRYCEYYLHNGFVTVGNEKMSKSLGNFVTLRDMLDRHDPEVVRTFLLSAHYRAPLNYDEESIKRAEARVARWREQLGRLLRASKGAQAGSPGAQGSASPIAKEREAFWAALDDDFHYDRALGALDAALEAAGALKGEAAAQAVATLTEMGDALGLLWSLDAGNHA